MLLFGSVVITDGEFKGRIGNYEDDHFIPNDPNYEWDEDEDEEPEGTDVAIIYFGEMHHCKGYFYIPIDYISPATTEDLRKRRSELRNSLGNFGKEHLENYEITELFWIEQELYERMLNARYREVKVGKKVFVSHSSQDKSFVRQLCTDIVHSGHTAWLDEWEIKAGDSIPHKIEKGIEEADFVIVVLSKNAIESKWVEREWHSKYWDEISSEKIQIIPLLYQ